MKCSQADVVISFIQSSVSQSGGPRPVFACEWPTFRGFWHQNQNKNTYGTIKGFMRLSTIYVGEKSTTLCSGKDKKKDEVHFSIVIERTELKAPWMTLTELSPAGMNQLSVNLSVFTQWGCQHNLSVQLLFSLPLKWNPANIFISLKYSSNQVPATYKDTCKLKNGCWFSAEHTAGTSQGSSALASKTW